MFVVLRSIFQSVHFSNDYIRPFLKTKKHSYETVKKKNRKTSQIEPSLECSRCFSKQGTSKLRQKPFVILIKAANVLNAVQKHCQAFDAEPERKALPIVVNAAIFKNIRVHHAATEDFQPRIVKFSQIWNENIHLEAWFREREKARSQTYFEIFAEKLTHKVVQRSL